VATGSKLLAAATLKDRRWRDGNSESMVDGNVADLAKWLSIICKVCPLQQTTQRRHCYRRLWGFAKELVLGGINVKTTVFVRY
jgi:hypothetical protein